MHARTVIVLALAALASACLGGTAETPLTVEAVSATPDDKIEDVLFHFCLIAIEKRPHREVDIVQAFPKGLRMIYTTRILDDEVNNGGFNQYFWNTSGTLAKEALDGLVMIGAIEHAQLMREAIGTYENERAELQKYTAQNTLEAFSESYKHTSLSKLDERYNKSTEDLAALRVAYVRSHPESVVSASGT
jgi:hypothetical protein